MKTKTINEYIKRAPKDAQKRLKAMRACVRKAAPGAKEGMKWSMPSVSSKRILVMYAGFKQHIGFYPTPSAIRTFAHELRGYKSARGSVQFPHDRPLPLLLVRKMTRFRVKESQLADAKWKSPMRKKR